MTPLHRASRSMMVEVCRRLINDYPGLSDQQTYMSRSPGGYTALHGMCVQSVPRQNPERHRQICDMLIDSMSAETGKGDNDTAFGQT